MSEQQTYKTHRRFDPPVHFFLMPFALIGMVVTVYHLIRKPSLHQLLVVAILCSCVLLVLKVRMYALKVQDRLISLEETLRMQRVLPGDLQPRIQTLTPQQMVGLRFASDGELADRVQEALDQNLSGEAIKKRIQTWRPDTFRV
jgi:cell division protein FtsL